MEEPLPVLTSWPTTAVSENQNTVKALTTQATHNNIEDRLTFWEKRNSLLKRIIRFQINCRLWINLSQLREGIRSRFISLESSPRSKIFLEKGYLAESCFGILAIEDKF